MRYKVQRWFAHPRLHLPFGDMPDEPFTIDQNIFKASSPAIHVVPCCENALTTTILDRFLNSTTDGCVGVAPAYGPHCKLKVIALATRFEVLLVRFSSSKAPKSKRKNRLNTPTGREMLATDIFCNPELTKYAFKMDKLATSLFLDVDSRITCGIDLLPTSPSDRHSLATVLNVLGGEVTLQRNNVVALFDKDESVKAPDKHMALQAWAAYRAGMLLPTNRKRKDVPMVNTMDISETVCAYCLIVKRDSLTACLASQCPRQARPRCKPSRRPQANDDPKRYQAGNFLQERSSRCTE